ncbi:MAG: hypothetical protein P1U57_02780 [Oleibacter sp.]|nr:hypothetical protein [Thalassolituus sp.]
MSINSSPSSYQNLLAMLGKNVSSSIGASSHGASSTNNDAEADNTNNSESFSISSLQQRRDKVSISLQAEKLDRINKEFFSGTISSDDIPALTQRLYKDGFISASEFQNLGGKEDDISTITQASNFLNTYISDKSIVGDDDATKEILNVINVIDRMDEKITPTHRKAEVDAFDFATKHTEELIQSGAPEDIIAEFKNVVDVLSALNTVRSKDQLSGSLSTYANIQQSK